MTARLLYLLITVETIQLEKVSLTDMQILRLFVNMFTSDDKYCLLNRDNLAQTIQILISEEKKYISGCFFYFAFVKSTLNFEHFPKKE